MDEEAKKAVTEGSSHINGLPNFLKENLPHSKAAKNQAYNEKLKKRAQKEWTASPRHTHMKRLFPTAPTKKYLTLVKDLPHKHTSILTQLCTTHAPLTKHLHSIGKADSSICPNC